MTKKILVMLDGNFLAHTSRPFEVAKILRESGFETIFAGEGQYMNLPKDAGFQVIDIKTINPEIVMKCARQSRCNFYDYPLIKELVELELELLEQVKPDLVVADFRVPLSTSCEIAAISLVSIMNSAWTNYYSVKLRAPEHLPATKIFGKSMTTLLMPMIKNIIIANDCRPFNKFRKEIGLDPRPNFWNHCEGNLNLIADIPEYGPTANLPENFHYIGPIVWEPEIESPNWFKDLDPKKPTIYITMGSTGYAKFFEQAIKILGDSEYQCIMTTGGMIDLVDLPKNFYVADYLPGSEIMKKSTVVICHGGNGTIYQAMTYGVPIIGIPTWHDQEFNLQRVEDLGFGIQISEKKFKPNYLLLAIEEIISQTSYKSKALHYKKVLSEYNGPKKAAELISSFV
jgi:MGT family glycosyltransferase